MSTLVDEEWQSVRETWENVSGSQVYLKTYNFRGEDKTLHIRPGQRGSLTAGERQINQDAIPNNLNDPFTNGMLIRVDAGVKLISDGEEEAAVLSPNAIDDDELRKMFSWKGTKKFKERLEEMTSIYPVKRLARLAEDEEVGASLAQVRLIEERISELDDTPKSVRPEESEVY